MFTEESLVQFISSAELQLLKLPGEVRENSLNGYNNAIVSKNSLVCPITNEIIEEPIWVITNLNGEKFERAYEKESLVSMLEFELSKRTTTPAAANSLTWVLKQFREFCLDDKDIVIKVPENTGVKDACSRQLITEIRGRRWGTSSNVCPITGKPIQHSSTVLICSSEGVKSVYYETAAIEKWFSLRNDNSVDFFTGKELLKVHGESHFRPYQSDNANGLAEEVGVYYFELVMLNDKAETASTEDELQDIIKPYLSKLPNFLLNDFFKFYCEKYPLKSLVKFLVENNQKEKLNEDVLLNILGKISVQDMFEVLSQEWFDFKFSEEGKKKLIERLNSKPVDFAKSGTGCKNRENFINNMKAILKKNEVLPAASIFLLQDGMLFRHFLKKPSEFEIINSLDSSAKENIVNDDKILAIIKQELSSSLSVGFIYDNIKADSLIGLIAESENQASLLKKGLLAMLRGKFSNDENALWSSLDRGKITFDVSQIRDDKLNDKNYASWLNRLSPLVKEGIARGFDFKPDKNSFKRWELIFDYAASPEGRNVRSTVFPKVLSAIIQDEGNLSSDIIRHVLREKGFLDFLKKELEADRIGKRGIKFIRIHAPSIIIPKPSGGKLIGGNDDQLTQEDPKEEIFELDHLLKLNNI